jgi:hypothetical protein
MIGIGIGIPFLRRSGGASNTARTQAFLNATGITDATIISALNAMDNSLISSGLLPSGTGAGKIKALYPIVGGSATTHKYNFVDPRDVDAAFRLTFFGGWTHSATGMLPNGTNAYADTFFNASTDFSANTRSMSYYNRTNSASGYDMGCFIVADTMIASRYTGTTEAFACFGLPAGVYTGGTTASAVGLTMGSNISTAEKLYKNGIVIDTKTRNILGDNLSILLGASNRVPSPLEFTNHECALSHIGDGFNDTESSSFYNIVQTFQTTLGRNV